MAKKYLKGVIPPCPGDPQNYTLVNRNGYYYWRLKRGTIKPATLNPVFRVKSIAMSQLSPVIKLLRQYLIPVFHPISAGSLQPSLFKWLQQPWIDSNMISFTNMNGVDFNPKNPLASSLRANHRCMVTDEAISLTVFADPLALKPKNGIVTEFVLEAILLWRDGDGFQIDTQQSAIYPIREGIIADSVFEFLRPINAPWMLMLKLLCFEGNKFACHYKHYALKVVETG